MTIYIERKTSKKHILLQHGQKVKQVHVCYWKKGLQKGFGFSIVRPLCNSLSSQSRCPLQNQHSKTVAVLCVNNSDWLYLYMYHMVTEPQGVQDGAVWEGELHGTPVGDKWWLPLSAGHGLGQQRDWIHAGSERRVSLSLCPQMNHSLQASDMWILT